MSENHIVTTQWGSKARSFAGMPDKERTKRMEFCAAIMAEILEDTGIETYLACGCLLGAKRDGKMIAHDFDIDLGFYVEAQDKPAIVQECRRLIQYLIKKGFQVRLTTIGHFKATKKTEDGMQMTVEFFVSWSEGDDFFLYFTIPGKPIKNQILPFGSIEIEGVSLPAPHQSEVMLEAIYGEGWAIPDPDFEYGKVDRSPFKGLTIRDNLVYWNSYYSDENANDKWAEFPSQFASFCAAEIEAASKIFEFGCGNGRDSLFFAQLGHDVTAVDYSKVAIDYVKSKAGETETNIDAHVFNIFDINDVNRVEREDNEKFDIVYSRFTINAVKELGQTLFLQTAKKLLKPDGKILLEFRNIHDPRRYKGHRISDNEKVDGHYRRFIPTLEVLKDIWDQGLSVEYCVEGTGFAKFGDEDPHVARIIAALPD